MALHPSVPAAVATVIRKTAEVYGFEPDAIVAYDNHKHVCEARHVAMYVARGLGGFSFPELGRAFGVWDARRFRPRDHTTIMSAVARIGRRLERLPELQRVELQCRVRAIQERVRPDVEMRTRCEPDARIPGLAHHYADVTSHAQRQGRVHVAVVAADLRLLADAYLALASRQPKSQEEEAPACAG